MNNSLTSRSNSSSVWICFSVSMVSSSFDNSRTAPNCFLASSALDNEPSIVEFMILTPQGYITGNCSHIVWNEKKGGPARCVLPDYCSSDRRNIGPLLPRLLPVTCSNTASAVIQLRDNCKTTLGQLWDNCKTTLGQLCDNFETTVRQLWDNFETSLKQLLPGLLPVTWSNTSSSVIQSPSSTFSRLLLLVFFTYMTLFEYASAILDWTHVLHSQNVKQVFVDYPVIVLFSFSKNFQHVLRYVQISAIVTFLSFHLNNRWLYQLSVLSDIAG